MEPITPRELEEYRALRATIAARGTARIWIFVAGLIAWAWSSIAEPFFTNASTLARMVERGIKAGRTDKMSPSGV